jgi:hypothetical protein
MQKENKDFNAIFGKGVGRMTTVGKLSHEELNEGYRVVVINPEVDFKEIEVKHKGGIINPLEIK